MIILSTVNLNVNVWHSKYKLIIFCVLKFFLLKQISEGYDYETYGEILKEFECIICHYMMREAMELPCHHAFCKQCLQNWEKQLQKER